MQCKWSKLQTAASKRSFSSPPVANKRQCVGTGAGKRARGQEQRMAGQGLGVNQEERGRLGESAPPAQVAARGVAFAGGTGAQYSIGKLFNSVP